MKSFVEYENCIMLLEPKDIGTTITASSYMSLKNAHRAGILVVFGAVTSATTTNTERITLEVATAEGGAEASIDFNYRISGALGDNSWGAISSSSATTGLDIASDSQDNMMVWIEINPDELATNDYTVARVRLTDNDDMAACLVTVLGFIEPRYAQTNMLSSTASAST
jgi:hypothetical protein